MDKKICEMGSSASEMKKKSTFREYLEALIIALIIALFIRTFVVQAFKIPSGSMESTLLIGDHIFVNKFIYGIRIPLLNKRLFAFKKPQRKDVIVFVFPEDKSKDFIKRVVGVEGDAIEIKNKRLYVNGELQDEPYTQFVEEGKLVSTRDNFGPVTIPEGKIFVEGDNRDRSYDSRFWGFVDMNDVIGKAFIIYFSIKKNIGGHWYEFWKWPGRIRWGRIGDLIH
jgi:signal peptidase I